MSSQPTLESPDPTSLLAGERKVLELIAMGAPPADSLDALCRFIDEQSGLMSAISVLDSNDTRLTRIAGPHLPEAFRRATNVVASTPTTTTCGAAVHRREQVIACGIASNPLFAGFEEAVRESGLGAAWSTPFFSKDGRVLGTFAVFDRQQRPPSDANLRLVERATHLASIAVERHFTEKELRESEVRFSTAFHSNPACMSITRESDGRFLYVNDEFVRMFGYTRDEAIGQTALGLGMYADASDRPKLMAMLGAGRARNVELQGRTARGEMLDLLVSLERIEILGESCLLATVYDITDRKRAETALRASEQRWRAVFDNSAIGIVITEWGKRIVAANRAFCELGGYSESEVLQLLPEEIHPYDLDVWHRITRDLIAHNRREVQAELRYIRKNRDVIWVRATVSLMELPGEAPHTLKLVEDISERKAAEHKLEASLDALRTLTGRLMRAQDEERRRIAQMLHETTAQNLVGLKMQLARLDRTGTKLSKGDRAALAEAVALVDQSMTEVRTLSYLLHPPFLDETGLLSALRWYAAGFANRSGVKVELDLPPAFERLPQEVETTLFRIVQEALINIHRHAGSEIAYVRLARDAGGLVLEIEDRGRGLAEGLAEQLTNGHGIVGVGIAGIRQRLQQLGGALTIESTGRGTTVRASVPPQAIAT